MLKMLRLTGHEYFIYILLFIEPIFGERACDVSDARVSDCSDTEVCNDKKCVCLPELTRLNETYCVKNKSSPNYSSLVYNDGNGSLVAGIVIPFCLILLVISAVYISKKYNIFDWIRQKVYQRNNNYDEFMIGQDIDDDDPPIA